MNRVICSFCKGLQEVDSYYLDEDDNSIFGGFIPCPKCDGKGLIIKEDIEDIKINAMNEALKLIEKALASTKEIRKINPEE